MTTAPKILAIPGSLRRGSYNRKLLAAAVAGALGAGADVTLLDLRDFDLPPYDGDLEQRTGLPEGARRLKQVLIARQGFLIASPEYNSSVSGTLKNAIDWASRPESDDEPELVAFDGKISRSAARPRTPPKRPGEAAISATTRGVIAHAYPEPTSA
ncbi:MAG: NAD(P)H-dependent oxidoreductase [Acidobacteria bacterium]|nr:NAD(P)H-dependent oxidoreductase [Acidobacteriota bacterium]